MIGIYDQNGLDVQDIVYFGLFALQHRGQESAGIAVANSEMLYHKGMGWVGDVFDEQTLNSLKGGKAAIGHVRYSTSSD